MIDWAVYPTLSKRDQYWWLFRITPCLYAAFMLVRKHTIEGVRDIVRRRGLVPAVRPAEEYLRLAMLTEQMAAPLEEYAGEYPEDVLNFDFDQAWKYVAAPAGNKQPRPPATGLN
jgi:hypothetical protein